MVAEAVAAAVAGPNKLVAEVRGHHLFTAPHYVPYWFAFNNTLERKSEYNAIGIRHICPVDLPNRLVKF